MGLGRLNQHSTLKIQNSNETNTLSRLRLPEYFRNAIRNKECDDAALRDPDKTGARDHTARIMFSTFPKFIMWWIRAWSN